MVDSPRFRGFFNHQKDLRFGGGSNSCEEVWWVRPSETWWRGKPFQSCQIDNLGTGTWNLANHLLKPQGKQQQGQEQRHNDTTTITTGQRKASEPLTEQPQRGTVFVAPCLSLVRSWASQFYIMCPCSAGCTKKSASL